jgi:NADH-quinone oxidoreductase subunit N
MSFLSSFSLTLPEVILSLGGIALMLVAAFAGDASERFCRWVAVVLFAGAGVAAFGHAGDAFGGLYRADDFSLYAKLLIYVAAAVSLLLSPKFFSHEDKPRAEYPVLILFAGVGMGMMVSAVDLMTLYVGIELNSLAAYVLASFIRKDVRAAEAGLKYFVLGSLASGILLYGMSLLYGFAGTTHYAGIAKAMADGVNMGELFGIVFVLAGLAFKISAVPFHMWTPDVYEGAPTPVTTFFASAPKVAGMAMLTRMTVVAMGPATAQWQQILIFMALASIVLGAVGAIGQTNIKRLLAYSSINNVGFALVGLAAGTPDGVSATMTYMAVYVVMTLGSFACVLHMRDADGHYIEDIASLSGLSRNNKALAAGFAILMFSLAGIPPLLGFWPKLLVFFAATKAGLFPLAIIAALGSVVGAYYYLRIIKTMYFDEPAPAYAPAHSYVEAGVVAISGVLLVGGYFLIPVLSAASAAAAGSLF